MEVVYPLSQKYSKAWLIPHWMYPLTEDINCDGKVDMRDIGAAAKVFGSLPGDPSWDKDADIVKDDKVDMRDIGRARASRFYHFHAFQWSDSIQR